MRKIFWILVLIIVIGLMAVGVDFYKKVYQPFNGWDQPVTLLVKKGSSVYETARLLAKEGILANYLYFKAYYKLFHSGTGFKSGEYLFDGAMTMAEVIKKLNEGRVILYKVTVQEGLTIQETAQLLQREFGIDAAEFVVAAADPGPIRNLDPEAEDLEGYLYPDTYMLHRDMGAAEMVQLMVKNFKDNFLPVFHQRAELYKLRIREVIVLASMIEKETAAREERFLISSVFHNRLRIGMPMGCDPTVIYALKREGLYQGKLGWRELKFDSPYNTRLYKNLPPGPICSPGFSSIEGALYPEDTKYLYFVAKDENSHYFSKNLREHNWAVKKYIINK